VTLDVHAERPHLVVPPMRKILYLVFHLTRLRLFLCHKVRRALVGVSGRSGGTKFTHPLCSRALDGKTAIYLLLIPNPPAAHKER